MELTTIRLERDGHVATVWLDRPHRHNAWTGRMHAEFRALMSDLERDLDVRVVVVTGTPPAFCVGGDSAALADHAARGTYDTGLPPEPAQPGINRRAEYDDDFAWMLGYRTPIIAAVNGAVAGVGLSLAVFCDLRFGSRTAKLTTAAPKLGLPAEYGLSWILPRVVGLTRANDLLLSGRIVTVGETESWGLWNGVADDGDAALGMARTYARMLATTVGPNALSVTKAQIAHDVHRHDAAGSVADSKRLLDEVERCARHIVQLIDFYTGSMTQQRPFARHLAIPAIASVAAAVLHATAAGAHAEQAGLARLFLLVAGAQAAVAVLGFVRADRLAAAALGGVSALAFAGWVVTRFVGIEAIGGLEAAQDPTLADTIAAGLALVALLGAVAYLADRPVPLAPRAIAGSAVLVGVLLVPGLVDATSHDHDTSHADTAHGEDVDHGTHVDDVEHAADHEPTAAVQVAQVDDAGHAEHSDGAHGAHVDDVDHSAHSEAEHATFLAESGEWPRPWDPTQPIDFSGVPGVSDEQVARAEQLAADTLRDLPAFADVTTVGALGYRSIGDAATGFEHYINLALINDDKFLDPTAPESLVYRVDGDERTLVSAMFLARETPIDDPTLTEYGGPLMQWHVHDNLCWGLDDDGIPVVKGVLESFGGTCPPGTVHAGGENPMVHVWIAPHPCGPFAALEGHGAGQASVSDGARMDQCDDHGGGHGEHGGAAAAATTPYDPELPIDLGGVEGVTPQQQAFAENLVAATVRDLPQWTDLDVVEAAGFRSIGDGSTGHEHYIQWDWIDDDVILDPDYPESLVFEPQPDGSKKLVSAMFMLPGGTPLDEVPDFGGALMQWHVHGDLCFTDDPDAPQVGSVKPLGAPCPAPLVDFPLAPMIHVWITPHECGPFAALDGVAGGQVPDGEAILCDDAHGSH